MAQFLASDHLTRPLEERPQNFQRLRLQGNAPPAAPELAGTFVELKHAEALGRFAGCAHLLSLAGVAYDPNDSAGAPRTTKALELGNTGLGIPGILSTSDQSLTREHTLRIPVH